MTLEPQQTLLHYRLIAKIGAGGMGEVWKALDTTLDREVAIKILPDAFVQDADRLARFEREAKVLASLNHPNIASIYGLHDCEGQRFLAMELVAGESLAERLQRGRLPVDEALDIASQIALALQEAHARGVIHRDLKPANVVLDAADRPKVLDFGLAKLVEQVDAGSGPADLALSPTVTSVGTIAGVILGTAAYMSPEQARGKPMDTRTDLWSFGCVLFEMLSGKQPFTGETITDLLAAIIQHEPNWDALPDEVPSGIRRLIALCLNRTPARRLHSAGDAHILIDEIRAGSFGEAPTSSNSSGTSPGKRLRLLAVTAVLALIAGGLGGRALWQKPIHELPLRKFTIPLPVEDSSFGSPAGPRISPDGKHVLFPGLQGIWVRNLDETETHLIQGTRGATKPFWSPDSRWVGFQRDQRLEKVPLSGGEPTLISVVNSNTRSLGTPSWGESGQIIFGVGEGGVFGVSANGGEVTEILPTLEGESDYHEVSHLPDGKGWVIVVHRIEEGYGTLAVTTPQGDRNYLLTLEGVEIANPSYSPTGHIVYRQGGLAQGIWAFPFSLERLERTGEPFQVAPGGDHVSVADDGTLNYVQGLSLQQARLVWFDRDGNKLESIGEPLENLIPFPDVSPDHKSLLITGGSQSTREIFVVDIASGARRQITSGGLLHDMAVWHPDGKRIISARNGTWTLHMTSIDGSVRDHELGAGGTPAFTADGSRLLFARNVGNSSNQDIYWRETDAEHDTAEFFIGGPGIQVAPAPSPDGRHVAFASNESGRTEVYLTTFPIPGKIWQVSVNGGDHPHWRADGRELFYATREAIYTLDVNPDTGAPSGASRLLFRRPVSEWRSGLPGGFYVAPDGQRFIVTEIARDENAPDPAIVVVQNWFAQFGE